MCNTFRQSLAHIKYSIILLLCKILGTKWQLPLAFRNNPSPHTISELLKQRPISDYKSQATCCSFSSSRESWTLCQVTSYHYAHEEGGKRENINPWPQDLCICCGRGRGEKDTHSHPGDPSLWNCDFPYLGYPESGTVLAPQHISPSSQASYRLWEIFPFS